MITVGNRFRWLLLRVYQLAADWGRSLYSRRQSANSCTTPRYATEHPGACRLSNIKRIFLCIHRLHYPEPQPDDPDNPICSKNRLSRAPDMNMVGKKLFSERLYWAFPEITVWGSRIARFTNLASCGYSGQGAGKKYRRLCVVRVADGRRQHN